MALASSSYENSADFSTLTSIVLVPPAAAGPPEAEVSFSALPEASSERGTINKSYYTPSSTIISLFMCIVLIFHDMQQRKTKCNQTATSCQVLWQQHKQY